MEKKGLTFSQIEVVRLRGGDPPHSGPGCGHINLVKVDEKCGEMRIKLSDHCYP